MCRVFAYFFLFLLINTEFCNLSASMDHVGCVLLLLTESCVCFLSHRERMQPEQTVPSCGSRKEEAVHPGAYMQCTLCYQCLYCCSLLTEIESCVCLIEKHERFLVTCLR